MVFQLKHINQRKKAGELSSNGRVWLLLFLLSIHFLGHKANNPGTEFVLNCALLQAAIYLYFSLVWKWQDCNGPGLISTVRLFAWQVMKSMLMAWFLRSSSNSFDESYHLLLGETRERMPGTQNHRAMPLLSHPLSKHLPLPSPHAWWHEVM